MSKISAALPVQNLGGGKTRQGFHDYQYAAIDRMVRNQRLILADQPGLGKTLEVLGTLERANLLTEAGAVSLILAPKLVAQSAWKPDIDNFVRAAYPDLRVVYAYTGSSAKKQKDVATALADRSTPLLIIANHNAIDFKPGKPIKVPALLGPEYAAIIIDEAHLVLPTTHSHNDASRTQFWQGLSVLRETPLQIRIPLSGTPFRGKLENILGYYRFMDPTNPAYDSFWGWARNNFRVYKQIVDRHGREIDKIEQRPKHPLEWIELQERTVLRRTKAEVLPQLPPKQYHNIELTLTPAMKKAYDGYEQALRDEADRAADNGFTEAAGHLEMRMYLRGRQLATCQWEYATTVVNGTRSEHGTPVPTSKVEDSPSLEWIVQWLLERDSDDCKVIIASAFTELLEWLKVELKKYAPEFWSEVLSGSTSDRQRDNIRVDFQKGDLNIVLLSQSVGTGITLDAADDLILVDVPNDPDAVEQVEDRAHRASSFNQVNIWRLIPEGTVMVDAVKKLDATYAVLRGITDSVRGVDQTRDMKNKVTARRRRSHGLEKNQ